MKKQAGFTLIELVIVIVILGILAATALPRFSDLTSQARISALNGLAGGLRSAASIVHATQLAQGLSSAGPVSLDNQSIALGGGYPTNAAIQSAVIDYSGFTPDGSGNFTSNGAPTPSNCKVTYANANDGTFPNVTITSSGCQ